MGAALGWSEKGPAPTEPVTHQGNRSQRATESTTGHGQATGEPAAPTHTHTLPQATYTEQWQQTTDRWHYDGHPIIWPDLSLEKQIPYPDDFDTLDEHTRAIAEASIYGHEIP